MIKCRSGKKVYLTELLAEDALLDAHSRHHYTNSGPINIYRCEDCGYYHFTSKGNLHPQLAKLLASGKLKHIREGNEWERKLRKR